MRVLELFSVESLSSTELRTVPIGYFLQRGCRIVGAFFMPEVLYCLRRIEIASVRSLCLVDSADQ